MQAAIGGIPLALGFACGDTVLTVAVLAIVLNACKIPALAFALGMFIPLELNVPLVVGGAVTGT